MARIKVAHIITMLELGGAQGNTLFTVEHLNRNGHEVLLICGPGGIQDAHARQIPDLKLYFVNSMVRPVRPWKDLACLIELVRILKAEKPDIVHTHSSKAGILGRIAAWLAGTPVVIHSIHGFGFNPYQKYPVRKLFVFLEKWCAKISHCLIAVSRENIAEGLSLGIGTPEKYRLIRSGVDIAKIKKSAADTDTARVRSELKLPPSAKIVLTVGPFKKQKDPLSFVRLAANVRAQVPETFFLMVGDGALRPQIEQLASDLKLGENLKLLGWRKDIPALMKTADIFVLTSLWEGLPRAGVEALIVGKPVIAFAVDGIREIVSDGQNGFLFKPGALAEMSAQTITLLKNPQQMTQLSHQAQQSIDISFDIHQMVLQQEELYHELTVRT